MTEGCIIDVRAQPAKIAQGEAAYVYIPCAKTWASPDWYDDQSGFWCEVWLMTEQLPPKADEEFLRQEYFWLLETIEVFDERALTIKSWSVTLSMVGIGGAFVYKIPMLLLLSGMASLLFWVIEAWWKIFQQSHCPRLFEIEALVRGQIVEHPTSPLSGGLGATRGLISARRATCGESCSGLTFSFLTLSCVL
jgi:hypothetical protein